MQHARMIALVLTLAGTATIGPERLLAAYREKTRVERGCTFDPDTTDLTICGRRHADRFRVPFTGREAGDETDNVPYERARMVRRRSPVEELSPFLVESGHLGVSVSTRDGVRGLKVRELAP